MSRSTNFNKEETINKAMNVFWNKGYENTSIKDLVNATGILKGSLYNTYSSKENMFLLCLQQYGNKSKSFHYQQGDGGVYLKDFFKKMVKEGSDKNFTKGCFIMNSCMEFAGSKSIMAKKAKVLFEATEKNLSNAVKSFLNDTNQIFDLKKVQCSLVVAAFSIREVSKFKKDKAFLKQIANNALSDLGLEI